MNEEDKNSYLEDFKKADGAEKLDMWYYALEQEVLWEKIIAEMSDIARQQGIDKKLDKMVQDEMKKAEEQIN
jgi:hypothetical protein